MRLIGLASSVFALVLTFVISGSGQAPVAHERPGTTGDRNHQEDRRGKDQDGQAIFRYDTFGDEQLWTNVLRMHEPIATVDPATALAVGLKVDVEALPPSRRGRPSRRAGRLDESGRDHRIASAQCRRRRSGQGRPRRVNSPASA